MDPVIQRVRRVDEDEEDTFVLLHVSSTGPRPLDLELIGTDNESGFSASLRTNRPASLGTRNSSVNQEDWETILKAILLGTAAEPEHAAVTKDVEAVSRVQATPSSIEITLQRRVEGITQRLGTISLAEDEAALEKVDLFQWCGLIITSKNATENELESRNNSLREKEAELRKLNDSLTDLVRLKTEEENQLLEKFSLLLNEKKLKIRDQQRLLVSSNVDPARVEAVEESRAVRGHSAGPSRRGKRKAGPSRGESDDESSGGFENMDVDENPNDSEQERPQTPEVDESTADEASEDEAPLVPPPTRKPAVGNTKGSAAKASSSAVSREGSPLPPKRELPLGKKTPSAPRPAPAVEGSETESDDEL